ncbi:MAG: methyltransferase domain-containing protein [Proteobacteria bacterium]|nr:methyltransferase domain-containing protein [Pseudomonadota bacterium]
MSIFEKTDNPLIQSSDTPYVGQELPTFRHAVHWKSYCQQHISPYLKGDVLEVGAGNGATTRILSAKVHKSWTCLEPDAKLCEQLKLNLKEIPGDCTHKVVRGTMATLPSTSQYDSILYFDVLEHIKNDHSEIQTAFHHLNKGGYLIILSPAYEWLYSSFDKAIGHFRRYDKESFNGLSSPGIHPIKLYYLDSLGIVLSFLNKFVIRTTQPKLSQILFWDRRIIPLSKKVDKFLGYRLGKSILGIWQKTDTNNSVV